MLTGICLEFGRMQRLARAAAQAMVVNENVKVIQEMHPDRRPNANHGIRSKGVTPDDP